MIANALGTHTHRSCAWSSPHVDYLPRSEKESAKRRAKLVSQLEVLWLGCTLNAYGLKNKTDSVYIHLPGKGYVYFFSGVAYLRCSIQSPGHRRKLLIDMKISKTCLLWEVAVELLIPKSSQPGGLSPASMEGSRRLLVVKFAAFFRQGEWGGFNRLTRHGFLDPRKFIWDTIRQMLRWPRRDRVGKSPDCGYFGCL